MMNKYLLVCIGFALAVHHTYAQCPNNNSWAVTDTFDCDAGYQVIDTCLHGGEYALIHVTEGNWYTFSTCNDQDFDTELTLYKDTNGELLAYSDDVCGFQSIANWLASFTGYVRVLVDRFPCGDQLDKCMWLRGLCGQQCDYSVPFSGDTTIVTCSGTVCDHAGNDNYLANANGIMTITSAIPGKNMQLQGRLDCELSWDYIMFYNGGTVDPDSIIIGWTGTGNIPTITAHSESITMQFFSDFVVQYSGFSFAISCIEPIGIEPVSLSGKNLYPNPNNGNFNLQLPDQITDSVTVIIIDNTGRVLVERVITQNPLGSGIISFNEDLAPGMYYLIIQGQNMVSLKFCVQ